VTGIGAAGSAAAAIERGKVDVAAITEPTLTQIRKRNPDLGILADTRDASGVREIFGAETYPASVLYSTADWIEPLGGVLRELSMQEFLEFGGLGK